MNASKPTAAAYFYYIGSIELPIEIWMMVPQIGAAEGSISAVRALPEVIAELSEINAEALRNELKDYGTWEESQLADHNENLNRILWIAALEIQDELITFKL